MRAFTKLVCAQLPVGQYEFIYDNGGYTQVGQDSDYGGQSTDVTDNDLFVCVKNSEGCNSQCSCQKTLKALVLADLGAEAGCPNWDLHLVDSFGDGWNGATLSVSTCDIYVTVTAIASGISMDGSFQEDDVCIEEAAGRW